MEPTIPAMFAARAAAHADETILRRKERGIWRPIGWRELLARVRAIAAALRADGLRPGEVAGILAEVSPDWVAADLAILSAGGVALGLYPTDAGATVAETLHASGCAVLFVEGEEQLDKVLQQRAACPGLRRIVILDMKGLRDFADPMCEGIDSLVARGAAADAADPDGFARGIAAIAPDDPAVRAYTSGTTGPARAVVLSHRNVLAQVAGAAAMTGMGPADERLAFLPMCHVTERILGLYQSLHCRSVSNIVESAETVPENLAEVRPTVMIAIPRVWQKIYAGIAVAAAGATRVQKLAWDWAMAAAGRRVDAGGAPAGPADALVLRRVRAAVGLDRLRVAWVGGAPVSPALLRWYRCLGIELREVYGLTECGGLATAVPEGRLLPGRVGAAVAHGEIMVSSDGEVMVRGVHVAGADASGGDWLRTGDLGRIEDGMLALTGRAREVLTLADGSTLSPAPMENELALSPFIADALVVAQPDGLGALVMVEYDTLEKWAQERNVAFTGFASLLRAPEVAGLIGAAVEQANAGAPAGRRIARFRLLDRNLAPEDPELTPMMRLRREVVLRHFAGLLDDMNRAA